MRAAEMREPPPMAPEVMDPDISMARTTSSAINSRLTWLKAETFNSSKPSTRMKLVGMTAEAVNSSVSLSMSGFLIGPVTVAPR